MEGALGGGRVQIEYVIGVALYEAGLADAGVAQEDEFAFVVVGGLGVGHFC